MVAGIRQSELHAKINAAYTALVIKDEPRRLLSTRLELKNSKTWGDKYPVLHLIFRLLRIPTSRTHALEVAQVLQSIATAKQYTLNDEYKAKLVKLIEKLKCKALEREAKKQVKIREQFEVLQKKVGLPKVAPNNELEQLGLQGCKEKPSQPLALEKEADQSEETEQRGKKAGAKENFSSIESLPKAERRNSESTPEEMDTKAKAEALAKKELDKSEQLEAQNGSAFVALPPPPPAPPSPTMPGVTANSRQPKSADKAERPISMSGSFTISLAEVRAAKKGLKKSSGEKKLDVKRDKKRRRYTLPPVLPGKSSLVNQENSSAKKLGSSTSKVSKGEAKINTRLMAALVRGGVAELDLFFAELSAEEIRKALSAANHEGNTFLHLAIRANVTFIQTLIENGADPSKMNNSGKKALDLYNEEFGSDSSEEIRALLTPQMV
ncbi:ankyrin repeat domain-containing protein [Parachlamydia sp. AcF125]|uniref:ankyrin repeat domain-containing protein n=1 Tax=Parachlamydia sp. AcF125 TaxID=2795736 RepID=UPI001BC98AA5|nr:ankyrin repeat domain-containing protein [Parachlamydia sp. AcF125]MBS4168224.1 hypothetical protein [Parachlamydia sp. AcF125]